MSENKRLIQGSYAEQRYLHSDEIFCKERNWNINLPSEREFKNGYCIITDKDNTAYSIDELVELLNEFQKENEQLKRIVNFYKSFQKDARELEKENKQFQDKIFALIDKKIKEYSNLEQRERTSNDTIEILKELKKELQE